MKRSNIKLGIFTSLRKVRSIYAKNYHDQFMLAIWPTPPKKEFIVFNRTLLTEFKTKILNDHEKRKYKVSPACLDFLRMIVVLVIAPEIDTQKKKNQYFATKDQKGT